MRSGRVCLRLDLHRGEKVAFPSFLLPELDVRALLSALRASQIPNTITTASHTTDSSTATCQHELEGETIRQEKCIRRRVISCVSVLRDLMEMWQCHLLLKKIL